MKDVSQEMSESIPREFDVKSITNISNGIGTENLNLENITKAFITAVKNLNAKIVIDKDVAGRFVITSVNNKLGEIY